jgi:hypothetical protein
MRISSQQGITQHGRNRIILRGAQAYPATLTWKPGQFRNLPIMTHIFTM